MVPASRAYLACRYLFNEYPLAASTVDHVPAMHTMVLMLRDGEHVRFFVLYVHSCGKEGPTTPSA